MRDKILKEKHSGGLAGHFSHDNVDIMVSLGGMNLHCDL
jgi:hypothetical protein